jgi:hypothetical protein
VHVTEFTNEAHMRAAIPAPDPASARQEEAPPPIPHSTNPLRDAFLKTSWASLLVPFFLGVGVLLAIVGIAVFAK